MLAILIEVLMLFDIHLRVLQFLQIRVRELHMLLLLLDTLIRALLWLDILTRRKPNKENLYLKDNTRLGLWEFYIYKLLGTQITPLASK